MESPQAYSSHQQAISDIDRRVFIEKAMLAVLPEMAARLGDLEKRDEALADAKVCAFAAKALALAAWDALQKEE